MPSLDSETEQSDGHQAADQPHLILETLVAAAGSSVVFVAPAACLIKSDCCGRECRESARAEPSRSDLGLDAVSLLRRIGCG